MTASPTITRRKVAQGAAWAIPSMTIATSAPAVAASACSGITAGQPLPPSAFEVTYVCDTGEQAGGLLNKTVAIDFGFKVSAAALSCGVSGTITSVNGGLTSRVQLSNGQSYDATNGLSVPASGTVGQVAGGCQSGRNGTQACGTTGASPYNVVDSTQTSSSHVTAVSLARQVTVTGYGTTTLYLNASGFGTTPGAGTRDCAVTFSVSATPLF